MENFATKDELNGLGTRLNSLEVAHMQTRTIVDRSKEDIEFLFDNFDSTAEKFSAKADAIGKKADSLGFKIVIGSFILVIGLIVKELIIK